MAVPPPLPPNRPRKSKSGTTHHLPGETSAPAWQKAGSGQVAPQITPPSEIPPPVPTSARPNLDVSRLSLGTSSINRSSISSSTTLYPHEDEKFSLTELIDNYSSLFPLRVRVVKGFYSERGGEESAIAADELYNFHFVKRSRVVSIKDVYKSTYVIPMNSATKFGLIYKKDSPVFKSVEDIINAAVLPKVVCADATFVGNNEASSVHRYEILAIREVEKASKLRRRPASLKVYSITKNMEKVLTKEVFGKFSTDPSSTQLFLPDFIKHINDPVPSKVRLFLDFESEEPLPDFLTSEEVTLDKLYVQTSVIASPLSEEDLENNSSSCTETETEDIPISLDIEVSVIPPGDDDNDDYEKLEEDTINLLSHFNPTRTNTLITEEEDEDEYSYTAQNQLLRAVRKGFETEGLNIETPKKIRGKKSTNRRSRSPASPVNVGASQNGYVINDGTVQGGYVINDIDGKVQEGYEDFGFSLPTQIYLPEAPPSPATSSQNPHSYSPESVRPIPYLKPSSWTSQPTPTSKPPPMAQKTRSSSDKSSEKTTPISDPNPTTPPVETPPTSQPLGSAPDRPPMPIPQKKHGVRRAHSSATPSSHISSSSDEVFLPPPQAVNPGNHTPSYPPTPPVRRTSRQKDSGRSSVEDDTFKSHDLSNQIEAVQLSLKDLIGRVETLEKEKMVTSKSTESKHLLSQIQESKSLTELENEVSQMREEIQNVILQMKDLGTKIESGTSQKSGSPTENYDLKALDATQILKMLDLMGLSKYQQSFQEAGIDGELLSECDDKILREELAVNSRIDQIKLMQIISGKRSVQAIFQKSYVTFEPRP